MGEDLMKSLISPSSSQPSPCSPQQANFSSKRTPVMASSSQKPSPPKTSKEEYPDVATYLAREDIQQILSEISPTHSPSKTPVPLSPRSKGANPEAVARLNHLAQLQGIIPVFGFEEVSQQRFSVKLRLGVEELNDEGPYQSKKDAKGSISIKGIEALERRTETASQGSGSKAGTEENWIGKLQEWVQQKSLPHPVYNAFTIPNTKTFSMELTISLGQPSSPEFKSFGSRDTQYPSKRAAKTAAAREAVLWLVENGHIPEDLTTAKKKAKLGTAKKVDKCPVPSSESGPEHSHEHRRQPSLGDDIPPPLSSVGIPSVKKEVSYAQRVNQLCPLLGLPPPEYRIKPDNPIVPSLHSGAAYFTHEFQFPGPYGEVRHISGKKAAKEACAKGVLRWLCELALERGCKVRDEGEKGGRVTLVREG
ncbi:MAG: hypothetical protein M1834_005722 [Cirrosporium novae-zelandiae]|nr:MAG: hypothetical protein M1834_005722 [Cirrosporium novae-zelandiae]